MIAPSDSAETIAFLRAELDRVTAERDQLIKMWPESDLVPRCVWFMGRPRSEADWFREDNFRDSVGPHATKAAAVRAAAGLEPEKGA